MRNRLITGAAIIVTAASLGLGLALPTPSSAVPSGSNTGPWGIALGDINKDGQQDIVVATGGGNTIRPLVSNGSALDSYLPVRALALNDTSKVAVGGNHACASYTNKSVRCWGLNTSGQLGTVTEAGDADFTNHDTPTIAANVTSPYRLALGATHSCAINLSTADPLAGGKVTCWGSNKFGELGIGKASDTELPTQVSGIDDAINISLGTRHTCAVLSDHTAKCWGDNTFGQLGTGNRTSSTTPVAVTGLENATAIGTGATHSCALLQAATIKCWGNGSGGRVGDGTGSRALVLTPRDVAGLSSVTALSVGKNHTCAISGPTKAVFCWGVGTDGQLGNGLLENQTSAVSVQSADRTNFTGASSITAGGAHTCAQTSDGSVFCWGSNSNGQIGDNSPKLKVRPLAVPIPKLKSTSGLSAGDAQTCAIGLDGGSHVVLCSGANLYGQIGNGFGFVPKAPIAAGSSPASLGIADINDDGNLDVVAPNAGHDKVQRFFGDGLGGFSKQTELEVQGAKSPTFPGPTPTDVVITDVDRDHFPDIVTANLGTKNLSMMLNDGSGEFGEADSRPSTGRIPNGLVAADLNGDKLLDFASATFGNGSMMVQIQQPLTRKDKDAGLTFRYSSFFQFKIGEGPVGVVAGDFDGDKIPDVATACQYDGTVNLILSRPNKKTKKWGFQRLQIKIGAVPQGIASGDVTGDGKPDIVVSDTSHDRMVILPTLGKNKYGKPIYFKLPAMSSPVSVAVGDVSGDRLSDIVVVLGEEERVGVLLSLKNGAFKFSESDPLVNRDAVVVTEPSIISGRAELPLNGVDPTPLTATPGEWDINNDGFADYLPQVADPNDDTALIDPYLYQWRSSTNKSRWVDIPDATTASYQPTSDDLNHYLQLCVNALYGSVTSTQACTEPTDAVTDPNADTGGEGLKNRRWKR